MLPSGLRRRAAARSDPVPEGGQPRGSAAALRDGDAVGDEATRHLHARRPTGSCPMGEPTAPPLVLVAVLLTPIRSGSDRHGRSAREFRRTPKVRAYGDESRRQLHEHAVASTIRAPDDRHGGPSSESERSDAASRLRLLWPRRSPCPPTGSCESPTSPSSRSSRATAPASTSGLQRNSCWTQRP